MQASLDRLVRARKLRELTQEDLAHLSDVSLSMLRALEAGADGVALGNFLKVLQGFNLLDQVEDWLDPRRDPETVNFVERRLGVGDEGRARCPPHALPGGSTWINAATCSRRPGSAR